MTKQPILLFLSLFAMSATACVGSKSKPSCYRCVADDPYFVQCANTTENSDGQQVCGDLAELVECTSREVCCEQRAAVLFNQMCVPPCDSDRECGPDEICDVVCQPKPTLPMIPNEPPGNGPNASQVCTLLCQSLDACSLKRLSICQTEADFERSIEGSDALTECVDGHEPDCNAKCERYFSQSASTSRCLQGVLDQTACILSSCDTLFDFFNSESACQTESDARSTACGPNGENFDGPYIAIDPTLPTFTKLLAPGVCPVRPDLSQIALSVALFDGRNTLGPESRIQRMTETVGNILTTDNFRFNKAPQDLDTAFTETAVVMSDGDTAEKRGVDLSLTDVSYLYPGGENRKDDEKLVILIMDHSGTLLGLDPVTGRPDTSIRSDHRDERISFFTQLVSELPNDTFVSLVKMNDRGGNIRSCDAADACGQPEQVCSNPVKNREAVQCGLRALQFNEQGLTPLNETLKNVKRSIIEPNADLNPVVILFTDGVEDGDVSGDIFEPGQAAEMYQTGINGQSIPIILMHLSAPPTSPYYEGPRGRSPALQALACQTGGEYMFLSNAARFLEDYDLVKKVSGRIDGTWRLKLGTSLDASSFEPGGYLLSTALTVTLGGKERTHALQRDNSSGQEDNRAWLLKAE